MRALRFRAVLCRESGRLVVCLAIACSGQIGAASVPIGASPPVLHNGASRPTTGIPFAGAVSPASEPAPEHPAATFLVKNCDDDGQDSLRAAIAAANTLDVDSAIEFDLNAMGCSTITLETGQLTVSVDNLTIGGPASEIVTIDGGYVLGHSNRIFKHTSIAALSTWIMLR